MKQKRIQANSIIVPLVVVAVVLSALLSVAGFINEGAIESGYALYGIAGMVVVCLLGAIAIFAAVLYQRREVCRTMQCAFNPANNIDDQNLDFTKIETPKEFVTGVFAASTVVESATVNRDDARKRNQIKLDQETEEIISQLRNSEFLIGSLGHQPAEPTLAQESTSMDFTIDMVSEVLASLQQIEVQAQQVQVQTQQVQSARTAEDNMPTFDISAKNFPVTVPQFPEAPVDFSEFDEEFPAVQAQESGYRGAHFKPGVEFVFEVEPLFTVLPQMKHARRGQPKKVEKAG